MKMFFGSVIVVMMVLLAGCGDGDNDTNSAIDSKKPTTIATQDDARNAVSFVQSMQLHMLAKGLSHSLSTQLGAAPVSTRVSYPVAYVKQRECAVGGTINSSGEKSNVFTYHVVNTYNKCEHIDNIVVNGTQTVDATVENNKLAATLSNNNIEVSKGDTVMRLTQPMQLYANRDFTFVKIILQDFGWLSKDGNPFQKVSFVDDFNVTIDTKNTNMYVNGRAEYDACRYVAYDIQTIVPLTMTSNGGFASGKLNINGAVFQFNNDNTATVTLKNYEVYTVPQDMDIICDLNPNELQFIRDDAKEVVLDKYTQLMWQDDSAVETVRKPIVTKENYDAINWFDFSGDTAATYCSELTLGGYNDWRLPTFGELFSITYEIENINTPYISPVFQHLSTGLYWSSDIGGATGQGAAVDFWTAALDEEDAKDNNNAVRCVRSVK